MKPKGSKIDDVCKCGHHLRDHEICDCPSCPSGVHECYAKLKNGNNSDFCECEEYEQAEVSS